MSATADKALERIRQIEESAPRVYSRWSAKAWRLACEGPATKLWDAIAAQPGAETTLEDYLLLLREAVGLQYLSASVPEDLLPGRDAKTFLAEALCDVVPRLLPGVPPEQRARALAQVWNVGEKLIAKPVWLNRYLAARVRELGSLVTFEEFLERAISEGIDEGAPSTWAGPWIGAMVDCSTADASFLPGTMHLATPSIVCVHDRRRGAKHVAVLLRGAGKGGPLCLGSTACLQEAGGAVAHKLSMEQAAAARTTSRLDSVIETVASRTGFIAQAALLSQRVWIVESAA